MHMTDFCLSPVTALLRDEGVQADTLLLNAAKSLQVDGLTIAGVTQEADARADTCCSDLVLYDLATGSRHPISQNLGPGSRGCRLDYGQISSVLSKIMMSLTKSTDALILNRFGYSESQGGGFRPLIEQAVELQIPVLLAVNHNYHAAWRAYAGTFSSDIPASTQYAMKWCRAVARRASQTL